MSKKKPFLTLFPWMMAVTFFVTIPVRGAEATFDSEGEYADTERSPTSQTYEIWGTNIPRFYYYQYYHLFSDYPWVVRSSYTVILCCSIGFLIASTIMTANVYRTQRYKKFHKKIRKAYFAKMKDICNSETENLSTDEISRRMEYKPQKWKNWQMRIWARILLDVTKFTNTSNPDLTNIQRIMQLIGFTDFVKRNLIHGPRKRKVRLLQAVRLTNMKLPDSIVTRLVNDKHADLRKAARTYYMLTAKDDPFIFFENQEIAVDTTKNANFSIWDKIEIHEIFEKIQTGGRALPKFIPILQAIENREMFTFMMHETAYWGSDQEFKHLTTYFESPDFVYRQNAFECMGLRRYAESEETLKNLFYKQTEVLRRTILNALLEINTGNSIGFYANVYQAPSSDYTRRTALRCLWMSGSDGRTMFEHLKREAKEKDLILFEHVESPIINDDSL